jgi:hypothetical protein
MLQNGGMVSVAAGWQFLFGHRHDDLTGNDVPDVAG